MRKFSRKRLLVAASFVAIFVAVSAVAIGSTLGRSDATATTRNSALTGGKVTLSNNVAGACSTANMLPGNASSCTLTATYGGSASGYLALDVLIETQAGNGGTKLYSPSDSSHDIQVTITSSSPSATYIIPTTATSCPGGAPSGSTCYELDDELVSLTPFTSSSSTVTFTTAVTLPSGTTTGYRGGAAQVILTAHATQSSNNSVSGCSAGHTCATAQWS
jgi:hypothetical protein